MQDIRIEIDADGIALVSFDVQDRSMNTFTAKLRMELDTAIQQLRDDAAIKGVVLTSSKGNSFFAGADLVEMEGDIGSWRAARTEPQLVDALDNCAALSRAFRAIETLGKPVAAAINGLALGGGLELALCCHYRVVSDDPRIKLGLPECTIGLLPGAGGTQRLPRLIGLQPALELLLEGKPIGPQKALALGFVDAVVPAAEVVDTARRWVLTVGDAVSRWDKKGFVMPGGATYSTAGQHVMTMANANLRGKTFGNYPAQEQIFKAAFEGTQVPIDAALRIETRRFLNTVRTPQAEAMVRTMFHGMQAVAKQARRSGADRFAPVKAGVIGAGMMGAGIAHAHALAGIDTVLIDMDQAAAERGRAHGIGLLDAAVAKGRLNAEEAEAAGARILATSDFTALAGADIVIEAVFEDRDVKADVTGRVEAATAPGLIFGSNTSTLPIDGLADASVRPETFIGIHFFSPVDRMQLIEIIRGPRTSEATVASAIDYALRLGKMPIVVNDSRGFYTSRVFGTYISEGYELLAGGVAPAIIDNVGRMTGMPRGPLELSDDVALDLIDRVARQTAADAGSAHVADQRERIVGELVHQHGRLGRKNGKGIYALWGGRCKDTVVRPCRHVSGAVRIERCRVDRVNSRTTALSPGHRSGTLR